ACADEIGHVRPRKLWWRSSRSRPCGRNAGREHTCPVGAGIDEFGVTSGDFAGAIRRAQRSDSAEQHAVMAGFACAAPVEMSCGGCAHANSRPPINPVLLFEMSVGRRAVLAP